MEVPGYSIVREIGRGGMATVHLAVQESLRRQVALKVMNPGLSADTSFKERFLKEGQIIAQLAHPQIITIYDFGSHNQEYFFSMEYLPGGTLKERIEAGLSPDLSTDIIIAVSKALGYAHDQGVVHRDIKPQNILFRKDGTPVLTDFGIARFVHATTQLTATGLTVGSPRYMSPEQIMGKKIDARSDIYALGVVFYEMLTGNLPFEDTEDPISIAIKHCTVPIPQVTNEH